MERFGQARAFEPRGVVTMKVSFILLAHEKPEQLKDLLGALLSAGSNVYCHHDASSQGNLPGAVAEWGFDSLPGKVYFAKPVKVVWGEWSIVQATLNCLDLVRQHDTDSDYFMLISGSCMPVKPVHLLEQYLAESGKDHIEAVNAETTKWVTAGLQKQRWSKYHFFNWRFQPWRFDTSLKIQRKLKISRKIPLRHTAHMGSQWWCLRRGTLLSVLELVERNPSLKRFYRRTWVPDELFFQTMVANTVPKAELTDELLTRYKFNSWGIPRVYYDDDYPELLAESKFFVRKVSHRAAALREKLRQIAPMQIDQFSDLLDTSEQERLEYRDRLEMYAWIEKNRWHSLESFEENHYDYIKSVPNAMLILIGSDEKTKREALKELDKLDNTTVYGDLFDRHEINAGFDGKAASPLSPDATALMRHTWHLQLGDISFQNPGKMIVFSLGDNALSYLEVLRWKTNCHVLMVDRDRVDSIDENLMSDLYLKSKVLHLLLDRHCEMSRVSLPMIKETVNHFMVKKWSVRSFLKMLRHHETQVRWPGLLSEHHDHWEFLKAIYSKIIIFVHDDPRHLVPVEHLLSCSYNVPLYRAPLKVIPANDNSLDWHYYLADLAHLNAKVHHGVLALAMDRASLKHLDTFRWKRNLLVVALDYEPNDVTESHDIEYTLHGYRAVSNNLARVSVFSDLNELMSDYHCQYVSVPFHDTQWMSRELQDFLRITPLNMLDLSGKPSSNQVVRF